jgi:bifunctional non-homologous end joining protein LigD
MTVLPAFTHVDKLLFPKDHITKGEVIQYYLRISPLFLKYAKKHPLTLQRYPQGILKPGFFQKHADAIPNWIDKATIHTKNSTALFVLANKKADLGYLANLNTIVFHSALFSVVKPTHPDVLIWDLDPSIDDFEQVIEVAFKLKSFISDLGIQSQIKTTGSKGLHIQVPLNQRITFEKAHDFAKSVAQVLAERYPKLITLEPLKKNRKGRVLIDHNRNFYSQTAVAAYSLRALPSAPVATPILWKELGKTVLSSRQFTLHNIEARIKKVGDVWTKEKIKNPNIHQLITTLNQEFKKR